MRALSHLIRPIIAVLLCSIGGPAPLAQDPGQEVFDQFFRFTNANRGASIGSDIESLESLPGESVDPFTGTLRIVRQDISLPGKAGLDLRIFRTYSSKIWGRADLLMADPLIAESERTVLGYGWSIHMGRLRNPAGATNSYSPPCGGAFPVYEAPDGSNQVFYPVDSSAGKYVSKEFWRLELGCLPGNKGACIWSDKGVRYEFSGGSDTAFFSGMTLVWPLTQIADPFGNSIAVTYLPQSAPYYGGAVDTITDTYNRVIRFSYDDVIDGKRLTRITVNPARGDYRYYYEEHATSAGARMFLSEFKPPAGPSELYDYAYDKVPAQNQYALETLTLPGGASVSYSYDEVSFFTGFDFVPFSPVVSRTVSGPDIPSSTWGYRYSSPGFRAGVAPGQVNPQDLHVTTVTRPDGLVDTHTLFGFGWVASQNRTGFTYLVGLTYQTSRASGAEVETLHWTTDRPLYLSSATYAAPLYSANCGAYFVWDDFVAVPVIDERRIERDGVTFVTQTVDFDTVGQPLRVVEAAYGQLGFTGTQPVPPYYRTSDWTYFYAPDDPIDASRPLNAIRGYPQTQSTCLADLDTASGTWTYHDCVENSWTYSAYAARKSETRSSVTTSFDYHGNGDLKSVTNALGQKLTIREYGNGTPTAFDFNGAFEIGRTVTWEGWIETETDGRTHTTTYGYDDAGRLTSITPPPGNNATSFTYVYDPLHQPAREYYVREARGDFFSEAHLDALGRVSWTLDSEGVRTSSRYDVMGREWFKAYPHAASIGADDEVGEKVDRDGLGRAMVVTRAYRPADEACDVAGACEVSFAREATCTASTAFRAPTDSATTWACDFAYGDPDERRLRQVFDARHSLWEYAYDVAGKLQKIGTPRSLGDRSAIYDDHRFLQAETSGESGTTTYERNGIGQMTKRTDARRAVTTYDYTDPLSRLVGVAYGKDPDDDVTQRRDKANNLELLSSTNGGKFDYTYDNLNRVLTQTWTWARDGHSLVAETAYHYDSAGCQDTLTYPSGLILSIKCDSLNRPKEIKVASEFIVKDVIYHPSGQPKTVTYGNGKTTTYEYDDRSRTKAIIAQTTGTTTPDVMALRYGYDGADNVISFEDETVFGSARTMGYDELDRLLWSVAPQQWGSIVYDYDELGNRVLKAGDYPQAHATTYGYDEKNRLVSASGQAFAPVKLTWSTANRLTTSSDGASYRYDGRGRRVQKTDASGSTLYHYDAAGRVLAETTADGVKLRDYIYLGNKLVAVDGCISSSNCIERQWYHTDVLGSVVARTDANGVTIARLDYQPWGEQWYGTAASGDRQYNGRVYDPGTGFHDYGARMYWPEIGRFVSADSYPGDSATPASLNRYSYVLNNPYRYVDPTGRVPAIPLWVMKFIAASEMIGAEAIVAARSMTAGGAIGLLITPAPTAHDGDVYLGNFSYSSDPTLPPKRIAGAGDVRVEHLYRGGDHPPAHAHVSGGGESTRIGPNGHPLAGDPELTAAQKHVVEQSRAAIRRALNKVGRWLERQEQKQQGLQRSEEKK